MSLWIIYLKVRTTKLLVGFLKVGGGDGHTQGPNSELTFFLARRWSGLVCLYVLMQVGMFVYLPKNLKKAHTHTGRQTKLTKIKTNGKFPCCLINFDHQSKSFYFFA